MQPWPGQFIGREDLVEGACQALQSAAGAGILLVGAAGVGKTTMAQHIVEQHFGNACVVQVRGSAATARLPFGALGFLLSEAAGDVQDHPVMVLQEASRLLVERAAGRKLLIVVDNAQDLDSMTATVLTQLARARMAKLMISVTGFSGVAAQFARMWSGGELLRLDLGNFSREESARFVEALLSGRVSRAAVSGLWELTAGNPRFLRLLALEQRSAGTLVQRDGVWVLAGRVVHSGAVVDVVRSWLGAFTPRQRSVLELLAFAAELPLKLLQDRGEADVLDELQDLDVLDVSAARPAMVGLKHPLVAAVLRQLVQPGRRLELWRSVAGDIRPAELPPPAALQFAGWGLDSTGILDRQGALDAARLANRLQDRTAALRFVRCVPGSSRDPEFVLEEARALGALGDPLAAVQAVERVLPGAGTLTWARLQLERHRALRAGPGSAAAAGGVLQELGRLLQGPPAGTSAEDLRTMRRELVLAEAEDAAFAGRFAQLPPQAAEAFADRSLDLPEWLRFGSLLAAACSLTGRAAEAVEIAEQLEAGLSAPGLVPAEREQVRGDVFAVYLALGMWGRCADMLDGRMRLFGAAPGVAEELAAGLLHILCGRDGQGLEALEGAIAQLRVADPSGVLPLGLAAAAYACVLGGDQARARQYLQAHAQARQTGPWQVRAGSDYFRIAAEARLGRRTEAVAELNGRAAQAAARGLASAVPLYLGTAARLGDLPSARRLAECTETADWPLARMFHLLAAGRVQGKAGLLLQACELARREGNDLLAYELAESAGQMPSDESDRRRARTFQREAFRKLDRYRGTRRRIEELSDFERNLALAAGQGRSSTSLAKELHLSPRTVDWHLGKIYSRLQVSGRAELREVLA
ncbi:AAA family ATPase [Arthrobacter sp. GCM10027362]|uniref:helix-turn-helix transcriptional regulator n=1 Tax=Arthrobacter sp. GCM10027362 TaxID=3273379 RepID=UPI00362C88A3